MRKALRFRAAAHRFDHNRHYHHPCLHHQLQYCQFGCRILKSNTDGSTPLKRSLRLLPLLPLPRLPRLLLLLPPPPRTRWTGTTAFVPRVGSVAICCVVIVATWCITWVACPPMRSSRKNHSSGRAQHAKKSRRKQRRRGNHPPLLWHRTPPTKWRPHHRGLQSVRNGTESTKRAPFFVNMDTPTTSRL